MSVDEVEVSRRMKESADKLKRWAEKMDEAGITVPPDVLLKLCSQEPLRIAPMFGRDDEESPK